MDKYYCPLHTFTRLDALVHFLSNPNPSFVWVTNMNDGICDNPARPMWSINEFIAQFSDAET